MITRRTFLKACATAPLVAVLPPVATAAAVTPFPLTASKTKKRLVPGDVSGCLRLGLQSLSSRA